MLSAKLTMNFTTCAQKQTTKHLTIADSQITVLKDKVHQVSNGTPFYDVMH